MSLQFERSKPSDITDVVIGLWERGEQEARVAGFGDREALLAYLLSISGEYSYTMKVGNEPVAVFGATHHGEVYHSWFMATERFNEVGKQATRFLNGFVKERVQSRPDATLEMLSAVDHPDAERWFLLLGFKKVGEKDGIFTRYRYQRRNKLTKRIEYENIQKAASGVRHAVTSSPESEQPHVHAKSPKG